MKSKIYSTLLLLFATISLIGCDKKDNTLNINILTKEIGSTEITRYEDLASMLSSQDNEDFMLATYSGIYSKGCSCWSGFQLEVMNKYVKENSIPIYYFDTDKLTGRDEKFGISQLVESDPEFYLFKDAKKVKRYKGSIPFFKNYSKFKEEIDKNINKPLYKNLYYINEVFLKTALPTSEKAVLLTERNGCGDCRYVLPKVVEPFAKLAQFKTEIWVFDVQSYTNTEKYDSLKEYLQLTETSNSTFGFGTGYVPTIQYYGNGNLLDAAVYFNDSLEKNGNEYKVSKTYYTEERVKHLTFLNGSNVETKILEGLTVPESEVVYESYWSQEGASKYHTPIFKQFLKTYCL